MNCKRYVVMSPTLVFHSNRVVLRTHPSFLPKVISDFHVNQVITLPTFFPNHSTPADKVLHLVGLKSAEILDKTKDIRKSDRLFANYGIINKGLAASKRSISRWIGSCISLSYQLSNKVLGGRPKAHSTRGKASTTALLRNVPIAEICKAATWRSVHTFSHHCLDSDAQADAQVGRASEKSICMIAVRYFCSGCFFT